MKLFGLLDSKNWKQILAFVLLGTAAAVNGNKCEQCAAEISDQPGILSATCITNPGFFMKKGPNGPPIKKSSSVLVIYEQEMCGKKPNICNGIPVFPQQVPIHHNGL